MRKFRTGLPWRDLPERFGPPPDPSTGDSPAGPSTAPSAASADPVTPLALSNLASLLTKMDRPEEALPPARLSIAVRRTLAEADPAAHESDLALTLGMLVSVEVGSGRPGSPVAVDAAQEAVEILRRLARSRPDRYGRQLQAALVMLRYTQDGHF